MNFIDQDQFVYNIGVQLHCRSDSNEPIRKWLANTWIKWFKTQTEYVPKFFVQVKSTINTASDGGIKFMLGASSGDDEQPASYYVLSQAPRTAKREWLTLSKYEQADADRGLLWLYRPTVNFESVSTLLYDLLEIRDYFAWMLTKKPDVQLSKYTMATLPKQLREWQEEMDRERQKAAADQAASGKLLRLEPGKDYLDIGITADGLFKLIRLCTPASLDLEAQAMHHCIDSYKSELYGTETVLMSLRAVAEPNKPLVTIEAHSNAARQGFDQLRTLQIKGKHNGLIPEDHAWFKAQREILRAALQLPKSQAFAVLGRSISHVLEFKV